MFKGPAVSSNRQPTPRFVYPPLTIATIIFFFRIDYNGASRQFGPRPDRQGNGGEGAAGNTVLPAVCWGRNAHEKCKKNGHNEQEKKSSYY